MKFWIAVLDGLPRMDIAGKDTVEVSKRGAEVIGPRDWKYYVDNKRVKYVQVKIEVMV